MTDEKAPHAGAVIAELIDEQLAEERLRKSSLESRGLSVITTSGALVALLLGIAALVTDRDDFTLPGAAEPLVIAALVAFTLAALGGLWCNAPFSYEEADVADLGAWLDPGLWEAPALAAEVRTAEARLAILTSARGQNATKALALVAAILAEVVGVGLLAVAVIVILAEGA